MRIAREYGVRIIPESERPLFGANAPPQPAMQELAERLRGELGPGTEVRPAPGRGLLFVRVQAADAGYWIGFPLLPPPSSEDTLVARGAVELSSSPARCSSLRSCSRAISRDLCVSSPTP